MKRKFLSFVLAAAMLLSVFAVPVSASTESERIREQILYCYESTLAAEELAKDPAEGEPTEGEPTEGEPAEGELAEGEEEREALEGLCATLVAWQLVFLGINPYYLGFNGKDFYDTYAAMDMTPGGYRVKAYPAEEYTLLEALNAITENGTRDVYNVGVGYSWTDSEEGGMYGHCNFIHAILDGMVYFVESNGYSVAGAYREAGEPLVCSIEEFAYIFSGWIEFEGIIYFGEKPYVTKCDRQETDIEIQITKPTTIRTDPCTETVDPWSELIREVAPGENFHVTGILHNTEGEYWYEVDCETIGYIHASDARFLLASFDGIRLETESLPGVQTEGSAFSLRGQILFEDCDVKLLEAYVIPWDDTQPVQRVGVSPKNHMDLRNSVLNQDMDFGNLPQGSYTYEIWALAFCSYVVEDGLQRSWKRICLASADFLVCAEEQAEDYCVITFDGGEGDTEQDQLVMPKGNVADWNVTGNRTGYRLTGWSLIRNGSPIQENLPFRRDTTVYALWEEDCSSLKGWQQVDGERRYFRNGQPLTGWQWIDGIEYYLHTDGSPAVGWTRIQDRLFYFRDNGAVFQGVLTIGGNTYFFDRDGLKAEEGNRNYVSSLLQ